jgi:predicted PurR-regulated permease PerM
VALRNAQRFPSIGRDELKRRAADIDAVNFTAAKSARASSKFPSNRSSPPEVLPNFSDKRQAVEISQHIEQDISAYLITITIMNAAVGLTTALAMWLCGLGDPILWGAVAFLLNYVPILGPMIGVAMFTLAGLLTANTLWLALLPAGLYFVIHLLEGEIITPTLLARRFTLNRVLVILRYVCRRSPL